jgi:uncharacterized RDD family membrane protein YckC
MTRNQKWSVGARRLFAFVLDCAVILGYAGLLAAVTLAAGRITGFGARPPSTLAGRFAGHAVAALVLTLPALLYLAASEASARGASLGKHALGLRVVDRGGGPLPFTRSLLRSALKLLPWELAHTALWHTPGWPAQAQPGAATWIGVGLCYALTAWYVASLFVGSGRTPYDRLASARITRS